jgi:hypothetical protein
LEKQVRYTYDVLNMFLKWEHKRDVMILRTFPKREDEVNVLRRKKEVDREGGSGSRRQI